MKRLAILCFSMLLISACSEKKESASQASQNDLARYTHSGNIISEEKGNSKIGDWRFDPIKKEIRVDINRSTLIGLDLGQGQIVPQNYLLGLYYMHEDFPEGKMLKSLFTETLIAVIPSDFSCGDYQNDPAQTFKLCFWITLHDSTGMLIHPEIGKL